MRKASSTLIVILIVSIPWLCWGFGGYTHAGLSYYTDKYNARDEMNNYYEDLFLEDISFDSWEKTETLLLSWPILDRLLLNAASSLHLRPFHEIFPHPRKSIIPDCLMDDL